MSRSFDQENMPPKDSIGRAVAALHDASFDDSLWVRASGLIDRACGSTGNILVSGFAGPNSQADLCFAQFCYRGQRDRDWERDYLETLYPRDERIGRLRQLPYGKIVESRSLYSAEEKRTSIAYNHKLTRSRHHGGLDLRMEGLDGSHIVLHFANPVKANSWSHAQIETIRLLLPHVQQFMRVRHEMANAQALGASLTELLENSQFGVIQLDLRGQIVTANDYARNLLCQRDGLTDQHGGLHTSRRVDDKRLQRLIQRALPPFGGQGQGGSMITVRPDLGSFLALYAIPIRGTRLTLRVSRVAAILLIINSEHQAQLDETEIGVAFNFTPTESRIATLLSKGNAVQAISTQTGQCVSTVRWHIKNMLQKQGVSRQVELVLRLMRIAGVPRIRV